MKRSPIYALFLILILVATDGQAQEKKNDVFGFGRKRNRISNTLFPGGTDAGTRPAPAQPKVERDSETIFRGGKPKKVESAAYLIKDGEKIEQPMPAPKTKTSLFSKFRKNTPANPLSTATDASVVEEKEKPSRVLATIPSKKEKERVETTPVVSDPVEALSDAPAISSPEPAFTAAPMEEKKSGGLLSFFSRGKKKKEPVVSDPVTVATKVDASEGDSVPGITAPTVATTSSDIPDAPSFSNSAPTEEKDSKKGLSIPNPISKIKKEPKPVSMEGAETIIENGEIVKEEKDIVESNIVKTDAGEKKPPRVVDGVKTYNSWEDVEARSVSAADRIISQMRQQ